jgi:SAM-dependent methyltransferase
MTQFSYIGSELDVFAVASNWKAYYRRLIEDYIGQDVLEVGAGVGATTRTLCRGERSRWVCLEPDPALAGRISHLVEDRQLPGYCEVRVGMVDDLEPGERFDTALYIDVLEHIERDREEAEKVARRLKSGGHLVVLSPAHPHLFTAFDARIGHYRRYTRDSLSAVIPENLVCRDLFYLDSVGAIASLCNRYILKSGTPTREQILFWDRVMIPMSRFLDPLFRYKIGKSIIGLWQKV